MAGVVDELQVDVGVVDRRIATERIVRDVERVVRPGGDRQPGDERCVEDRRRDLADAAAETGLDLTVDDHRSLEKASRGRAVAGRLVEGERRAGRDQLPIDQVSHELNVVDPIGHAAEERLVGADRPGDPERLRLCRRAGGLRHREGERGDPVRRPLRGGKNGRGRLRDIERDAGLCRHDSHRSARTDGPVGVARGSVDRLLQPPQLLRRPGASKPQSGSRVREVEQRGDPPPGQLDTGRPDRERDRRGHGNGRRPLSPRQRGSGDVRRADVDGQRSRAAVERGERREDDARRRRAVEQTARLATHDLEVEAPADEPGVARRPIGHLADQPELVRERRIRYPGAGCDIGGEQLQLEAAIAADEPEPVAVSARGRDGGGPVDLHAELLRRDQEAMRTEREDHRCGGEALPAPGQLTLGCGGAQTPDIDAGDPRSRGEAVGRAREREPGPEREDDQEHPDPGHTGPEASARGGAAACKDGRGGGGHGGRILAQWEENLRFPSHGPSLPLRTPWRPALRLPAGQAGLRRQPASLGERTSFAFCGVRTRTVRRRRTRSARRR